MMPSVCAAAAMLMSQSSVARPDQWHEVTRYDTMISLFPSMSPTTTSVDGRVGVAWFFPSEAKTWGGFQRGSSGGFDLSAPSDDAYESWSGVRLVRELRQLSGLTWQQAADLVGVRSRTLHNWAAGQTISEKNLRRLGELLAVLRYIDKGYAEANRDFLLNASIDGETIFALLKKEAFDQVKSHAGRGIGRTEPRVVLPQSVREKWGAAHFGADASAAVGDLNEEILPIRATGKRPAKARRKVW